MINTHVSTGHAARRPRRDRRRWPRLAAVFLAFALVGAACGGGSDDEGGSGGGDDNGGEDAGTPVPGGELVYGLEAENSGGWCLPEGQLAVSGIMVARAIYDTLTVPDENAEFVPFLAESVEPDEDFTVWTIKLRDGVKFHDGSALDATVVKNNLDAYRGQYPGRTALLLQFVFQDISSVEVVDDLTLTVTTATPWPSFPSYLYSTGRAGIMAQAQLDDPDTCDSKLIGTGPFVQQDWVVNDHFTATKNPDYWLEDPDGAQLPYLDSVTFRPFPEGDPRVNALLSGELNALHASGAPQVEALEAAAEDGQVDLVQSDEYAEVSYGMLNTSKPPFDNPLARQAAAYALNREETNSIVNLGLFQLASGPFGPGEIGYLDDAGFPEYDPDKAKELIAQYEEETGQPLSFTFTVQNTPDVVQTGQLIQEQAKEVGIDVQLDPVEQATLISRAIAGDYQAITFRNHPGGDPDNQYVWWHSGLPTNFGRIDDPEIDALLEQGRAEPDATKRQEIYADINREFAKEVYNIWLNWTEWTIATTPDVHGVQGLTLPNGAGGFPGLADGHSLAGVWIGG